MARAPLRLPPVNGQPVRFAEAIRAAEERGVVLPGIYYGQLQGIARQLAFSIAGITAHDQLKAVMDSLTEATANGQTLEQWQRGQAVKDLGLPRHRLDNIFRTNIQANYQAGHWEQFERNKDRRPYLMYDAINDSRVRPTHLAMDGIIRPVGDPFWRTHAPPNGYRCRCGLISLTEAQAKARSGGGDGLNKVIDESAMQPDKGWNYSPRDRLNGVEQALSKRREQSGGVLLSALNQYVNQQATIIQDGLVTTLITQALSESEKQDFAQWANQVIDTDYKARHEFKRVGTLPDFVMADEAVKVLSPKSDTLEISDYLLRHGQRQNKSGRHASLPLEEIMQLPVKIAIANWVYDAQHKNIIGFFDINHEENIGKAVVTFNYDRKGVLHNAVVTTGVVNKADAKSRWYREIKR